ncbi:MAG: hypothetical protein VB064_09375 [Oscillospiraceae bacterium]|nr:hypothetical protein [Oscillospiraceae bacterium]
MKQSKMLLFFMVTFELLFAGCTNLSIPGSNMLESPSPAASETAEVSAPLESSASVTDEVFVSVDYATDELINKYDSFYEFVEFKDEGYQKIIFTTCISVKDFRFIEVGYKDEDINVNKVLYSMEELSPEKPFVVTWMEWGSIPHRGISFVDETNKIRYFYIAMSGEDGSLLLVEFKNA